MKLPYRQADPMTGYTKLFGSIVASTIWREDNATRIVWITMLALANQHGIVEASLPGLADLARVSVDDCRRAISNLEAPDPDSRTKEHEGRRIQAVDGGWLVLNHAKYRAKMRSADRTEYMRVKKQEERARKKQKQHLMSTNVNPFQPIAEAEAEAEEVKEIIHKSQKQIPPSREQVSLLISKAGLPSEQADAFWNFYESKGWMVGKNKMVSVAAAIGGWAARYRSANGAGPKRTETQTILWNQELERCRDKMRSIKASYSEHQPWTQADKDTFIKARERKAELQKLLGVQV